MRTSVLIASAALAVAGCESEQVQENRAAAGETLTANDIAANDVTAIDAVTGADANMAEDVELTLNDLDAANATDENGAAESNTANTSTD